MRDFMELIIIVVGVIAFVVICTLFAGDADAGGGQGGGHSGKVDASPGVSGDDWINLCWLDHFFCPAWNKAAWTAGWYGHAAWLFEQGYARAADGYHGAVGEENWWAVVRAAARAKGQRSKEPWWLGPCAVGAIPLQG